MEKRNIYKTDDVLIIGSFLMLLPALFFSWPWLSGLAAAPDLAAYVRSTPELLGGNLIVTAAYLSGALFSQILGRILRHREKQTLDILDTVMYMGQASITQLAGNLAMPEGKVRKLAERLCRIRRLGLRLEGDMISRQAMPSPAPFTPPEPKPVRNTESEDGVSASEKPDGAPSVNPGSITGAAAFKTKQGSLVQLSPELRDYLKNDKSDIFSKLEQISRIAETGGEITPEELEKASGEDMGKPKISQGKIILLFILFMTPLWPIPLVILIVQAVKKYKKLKDKDMVDLHFDPGK